MLARGDLSLYTPAEISVDDVPGLTIDQVVVLRDIHQWIVQFLTTSNPDLGRNGPVCPYARSALDHETFYLACLAAPGADDDLFVDRFHALGDWYVDLLDTLPPDVKAQLAFAVSLPDIDPDDTSRLLAIHARLKTSFVTRGLMIGQFHPRCDEPGLWNNDFRPLRAPRPLLAVRQMVSSDLPFLLRDPTHTDSYFDRFGPELPAHVQLYVDTRA